jgi:hypothetical protein
MDGHIREYQKTISRRKQSPLCYEHFLLGGNPEVAPVRCGEKRHYPDFPPGQVLKIRKALSVLKAYSFVSGVELDGSPDRVLNMHRLVFLIMRRWRVKEGISETWATEGFYLVWDIFSTCLRSGRHLRYLGHVWVVLGHYGFPSHFKSSREAAWYEADCGTIYVKLNRYIY